MDGLDVQPSLWQQGNQKVDRLDGVLSEIFLTQGFNSDSGSHPGDLLGSEPDGSLELLELSDDGVVLSDLDWESGNRTQGLTDESDDLGVDVGGNQDQVVLSGPLHDGLLVLVESLESIEIDVLKSLVEAFLSVVHVTDSDDLSNRLVGLSKGKFRHFLGYDVSMGF